MSPLSRHAAYRHRKRAGEPVRQRRTVAELVALEAKPLEQRTPDEKEAVRNHRKELKRRETRAAAAAAPAPAPPPPPPPPPTRSCSPRRPSVLLSPPLKCPSPPPPPPPPPTRSCSPRRPSVLLSPPLKCPSPPPPAIISPDFMIDALPECFSSPPYLPAAAAPLVPTGGAVASTSSIVAAAAAMSSASKLRATILKRRAAMSPPQPDSKKRHASDSRGVKLPKVEESDIVKMDTEDLHPSTASNAQGIPTDSMISGTAHRSRCGRSHLPAHAYQQRLDAAKASVAARSARRCLPREKWLATNVLPDLSAEQALCPDWWSAEDARADKIIADVAAMGGFGGNSGISEDRKSRIRWNLHMWGYAARRQKLCTGTEKHGHHEDAHLCTTEPFQPSDFFGRGGANHDFAHWSKYKRQGNRLLIIGTQAKCCMDFQFVDFSRQGRFLRKACHNIETYRCE